MFFDQKTLVGNCQKIPEWKYGSAFLGQKQIGWKTFDQWNVWFTDLSISQLVNMAVNLLTIFFLYLVDQMSDGQMPFEQKILLEDNQKCRLWKYGSVYFGQMQTGWKTFYHWNVWFTDLVIGHFVNMAVNLLTISSYT